MNHICCEGTVVTGSDNPRGPGSATGDVTAPRIVAVGASAGGLEAIGGLLSRVGPGLGCAYVVLQHLAPTRRSTMAELLSSQTSLTVLTLADDVDPVADTVYVVPAGFDAEIVAGRLRLRAADAAASPKPSIDLFFTALAADQQDRAIGIVLSGTGADGSAGLRVIAEAGGLAVVQQPDSAKYDGMPSAAIESGPVAFVGTPEQIATRLPDFLGAEPRPGEPDTTHGELAHLLSLLSAHAAIDFSGYKSGTVRRRIQRRQRILGANSLAEYAALVAADPGERDALARDMLISVTAFFREPHAFDAMSEAIAGVVAAKDPQLPLRLWVAGCATGEEAYTLAMLIAELTATSGPREVQIFATDVDERALGIARRGVYPTAAVRDLPSEVIQRSFRAVESGYEIDKRLRDMIVFARHNVAGDPPFLRLDAITCRNVLIYFDTALQSKVLGAFHFALNPDGILLLGKSETAAPADTLFAAVDRSARVYRKVPGDSRPQPSYGIHRPSRPTAGRPAAADQLLAAVARGIGVTVILCDHDGTIRHTVGQVVPFLVFPTGVPRLTILDVIAAELRAEVSGMLHRHGITGGPQRSERRVVGDQVVRVLLEPVSDSANSSLAVLICPVREHDDASVVETGIGGAVLANEQLWTREQLQALLRHMATSNEHMQALSAELQAANEELQATNEELEASNEELQATNEELVSLNEEFDLKATELARLSEEYEHLYQSLPFAVLVFDGDGSLLRFNDAAASTLGLTDQSIGHPIGDLELPDILAELGVLLDQSARTGSGADFTEAWDLRVFRVQVTPVADEQRRVVTHIVSMIDMTDITYAQQSRLESEARLRTLLEATTAVYGIKTISGAYQYVNQPFLDSFGLSAQPTELTDYDILPRELAGAMWRADREALRTGAPQDREHAVTVSGTTRVLASTHRVLQDRHGVHTGFLFEARDVTAQKEAEDILRVSASVFEQAGEAIVITDPEGRIQTCNFAFAAITGYTGVEVAGMSLETFLGERGQDGESALWAELHQHGRWRGEIVHTRKSGESYPAWVTVSRVDRKPGTVDHFVAVFSDISQIKNVQRLTEFLSTHDELTRLPNRALFAELLDEGIERAKVEPGVLALFFIDIDNFKYVNDMLGHSVGDELLKRAATRIRAALGPDDAVARFGGDEFVAIVRKPSRLDVEASARGVVDELARTYTFDGLDVFSSASVGIAIHPADGVDSESLLNAADAAMYHAKSQGRDRIGLFDPTIGERLRRDARIERGLRRSLAGDDFRLVFQPIHRITGDRPVVGLEALLRWEDGELGTVSPAEFIPIAERCGLIVALDRVARDLLLDQLRAWDDAGYAVPPASLNVSPWCLREAEFAAQLLDAMSAAGIAGGRMRLEITEGALLHNEGPVRRNLMTLSEAGVAVSIDDFGTGYSSLSYLRRLPLAQLKIDQSFTAGIGEVAEDDAVALAILGLAENLGLTTVAEGIENEQQRSWLERHGCEYGQGYGLSPPHESATMTALLRRHPEPR